MHFLYSTDIIQRQKREMDNESYIKVEKKQQMFGSLCPEELWNKSLVSVRDSSVENVLFVC